MKWQDDPAASIATRLDAAEALVMTEGAAALSVDAVAKAAGITKGGRAMRLWHGREPDRLDDRPMGKAYDAQAAARTGSDRSPQAMIHAHLAVTRDADDADHSRSAVMMAALLQHPDQLSDTRDWYATRLSGLDLEDAGDRQVVLAFLAGEGAFLLKALGLIDLSDTQWRALFDDMLSAATSPTDRTGGR
ncbi:MAG: TetR/AcrR family transcriptional regulator [Paracoccus hibiscisoli]|uniref:TetR/AcrR family transcriptional regulator n=1 Tax=Paracoccus hibiscisoli TaxID=2023261 RepID=UPI00391AF1E2